MIQKHTSQITPPERFELIFSPMSLARYKQEFETVRAAIKYAFRHPACPVEDSRVLRRLYYDEFNGDSFANMRPSIYKDEWRILSRALRNFHKPDDYSTPWAYQIIARAYRRRIYNG